MLHRPRTAFEHGGGELSGPVEVDETYMGGKRKKLKEADLGRGPSDKEVIVGVKDRETNKVTARHFQRTDVPHVADFVAEKTKLGAKVYNALDPFFDHESVNHSVAEYVRERAHTNGMESFWAIMKRGHEGIYHKMSPKHLQRYVDEFEGRHNVRNSNTIEQMEGLATGMIGKRLRYDDLTAENALAPGARSASMGAST